MKNYVYMVRCRDDSLYTGWTDHVAERLEAHNSGRGARYTRSRGPVRLVHLEGFSTKEEAMRREWEIKQLTRQEKEALIEREKPRRGLPVMGRIYYLMGKSASGKDAIYKALLKRDDLKDILQKLVIYTTRPIREGEREGVQYHFTDQAGLEALLAQGKVAEQRTYQTVYGPWHYFTVDDDEINLAAHSYLAIGTLVSYKKMLRYYGKGTVIPLYIETQDGLRLERALRREKKQAQPGYEEMCRRFLADQKDFSEEKLRRAGITKRFENNTELETCADEIAAYILEQK